MLQDFLRPDGNWFRLLSAGNDQPAPALFLDRDGVLISEVHYLSDPQHVRLMPGSSHIICKARAHGWKIVIITNQSGIGRGYFGWDNYFRVEERLLEILAEEDAVPDAILACPAPPSSAVSDLRTEWRKPGAGMILAAAKKLNLLLDKSVVIGDKASDVECGKVAGVKFAIHVATGHGETEAQKAALLSSPDYPVWCVPSLIEASEVFSTESK